ncbi:AN1-type zinc finger protein 4 [Mitosporidium daphniae]
MTFASSTPSTTQSGNGSPSPKPSSTLSQSPLLKPQSNMQTSAGLIHSEGVITEVDVTSISLAENLCKSEEAIHSIDFVFKSDGSVKNEFLSNNGIDFEKPTKKKQKLEDSLSMASSITCASSQMLECDEASMDSLSISVMTLMGNVFTINDLYPDDSLDALKMNIFEVSGIFPENQILLLHHHQLPASSSLAIKSFGIVNNSSLKLLLSMSGGPGNFMLDSFPANKCSQDIVEDDFDFSPSPFTIEELLEHDGCDDFPYDSSEDIACEANSDSVASLAGQSSTSKTFIYRSENGGIFFVEITGTYTDISLLTLLQSENPATTPAPLGPAPTSCFQLLNSSQASSSSSSSSSSSLLSMLAEPSSQQHAPAELAHHEHARPAMAMESNCFVCNKKVRESLQYPCKCSFFFCQSHKPPHLHNCSFNYCTANREELSKSNPPIVHSTLREFQ